MAFNATTTSPNRATLRLSKYDDWGNLRPENVVRFDNKEYREESIKNQGSAATDWSYKQTSPTEDTCTDVAKADGAEATVTGLSSGTSYIYKAYSGSGCTDANALGEEASFRTHTPAAPTPPPASPEISASAVTATTATLTIANYEGSWYYKRTAPTEGDHPYSSCSAVVTGTSVELMGLSASTGYSFTAYSDGGCTTELATAKVSTPAPAVTLTPSDATANSLKLTITNYSGNWYYKHTTPSSGQCSNVVSGTTTTVSNLSSGTSYIFKAYSDSGCTTELATAAAINTLAPGASAVTLIPSDATANSLKLTIANHSGSWYYTYTTPSSGQCSSVVSDTITTVTVLDSKTSYSFTAYSDSGCTSVIATGASITTLAPPRAVNLSSSSLAVMEGSTATYTVVLDSEPTDTVTVALGSSDATVATVSPTSLSFTISNWDQAQSVTVTGTKDSDTEDGATTISHRASGGGYGNVTIPDVKVTVEDRGVQVVQKRVNQVVQEVTPEVNRVVSANTANAVTQRVSQVMQGTLPLAGTQISWGSLPNTAQGVMELARRWMVDGETISVAALLDNSSFTTSFLSQSQATATEMEDGATFSPWGVWGAVDYGQIASGEEQDTTEWDAGMLTVLVGADRMMNDRLLAGAALAWSSSSLTTRPTVGVVTWWKARERAASNFSPSTPTWAGVLTAARASGPASAMDGVISPLTMRRMQQPQLT